MESENREIRTIKDKRNRGNEIKPRTIQKFAR